MKRRTFSQLSATLLAGAPLLALNANPNEKMTIKRKIAGFGQSRRRPNPIKARRLKAGDTIGLIAPGSSISDQQYEKCLKNLMSLGFKVKAGNNLRARHGYLGGTDEERLSDLHTMFSDNTIDGIWCARGGYGCTRLLPKIDYDLIRKNPKVLIGYSDITALLNAISQKTGLIGFHGPVGASKFTDYTTQNLRKVIMEPQAPSVIQRFLGKETDPDFQSTVITEGEVRGKLVGGNLSLLAAMAGTRFGLDYKNKIVFIEDIGEKPYKVDRMLTQLLQAGLTKAKGIALGVFADCKPGPKGNSLSLEECLKDRLGGLGIPVVYGLSIGHIDDMCTLPIGVEAKLNADLGELTLLEAGVF